MSNAPAPQARMIKMKAKHPCRVVRPQPYGPEKKMTDIEEIYQPGQEFLATEEEAKDFEKVLVQHTSFAGQRFAEDGEINHFKIQRAVRL